MPKPTQANAASMRALLERLFPLHRALVGPGAQQTLEAIRETLPIEVSEYPSGGKAFDWTIPKGFSVNEAWVEGPDGRRVIDYADCLYHVWNYSQPFSGTLSLDELKAKVRTEPALPDAVPWRFSYYREDWGLCASQNLMDSLEEGDYRVHIDTELSPDALRIGEYFLPGESDREILITCYICHPLGANDNLSGTVLGVELFKLLRQLPRRRYSYRLAIWPEGIGSIAYLANNPERIKRTLGGYVLTCCGDPGTLHYKHSIEEGSLFDRAALHALEHCGQPYEIMPFAFHRGSDEAYLSGPGFKLPMGSIMHTPYGQFPEYHTSADDLDFVTDEALLGTLQVYWNALMAIEANRVYAPTYQTLPFLSGHGVYPYDLGAGDGSLMVMAADAYYHLMGFADGQVDLLSIAERTETPMELFARPVEAFLRVGLLRETEEDG
ncbi:hypothetical protein BerOc1_01984 [Pseudodesulfovibrio hydrargyri]|uniref:Peptidase family M28 n=1 Tax=Pseudodesulfovibrio hydrargyri TaxID=2125990 RepID=A0A1J5MTU7_9BACT|nr:DUF4910 domain-containing protein [Pseudodesulfovibrio hydrargyri]OIQ50054.1 hypothetical protein BerOc1_01984 [Pseudodesulfovibrio hydrargyri]